MKVNLKKINMKEKAYYIIKVEILVIMELLQITNLMDMGHNIMKMGNLCIMEHLQMVYMKGMEQYIIIVEMFSILLDGYGTFYLYNHIKKFIGYFEDQRIIYGTWFDKEDNPTSGTQKEMFDSIQILLNTFKT